MKKLFAIMFLALLVISMVGVVSAVAVSQTLIAGKIYNADYSDTVDLATVEVTCDGNFNETESLSDGTYSVTYDETDCGVGDTLSVYAICIENQCTETDSGNPIVGANTKTGEINDKTEFESLDMNLGVVNVPLVPEFGIVIGALTMLSAVVVFFFVRKQ